MVMVKPGMPYLDIVRRVKETFARADLRLPGVGRIRDDPAAAANGWLDGDKAMMESLIAFKRAGADGVLTYFAPAVAEKLKRRRVSRAGSLNRAGPRDRRAPGVILEEWLRPSRRAPGDSSSCRSPAAPR